MNCPSRPDPEALENGWNQSPNALALHKRDDLNKRANLTSHRNRDLDPGGEHTEDDHGEELDCANALGQRTGDGSQEKDGSRDSTLPTRHVASSHPDASKTPLHPLWASILRYARFIGPGFLVSVAYIDPGNYATDVSAGATYRFKLLVMILAANIIAIFLQSLCIRLGSVTGLNLAENIKLHCPPWLNYVLWFFAEAAIIATDIAEVIGTAIALRLLLKIPLVGGCAISIADVLIILVFYRPNGSMRGLRVFEFFVMALVLGVVICFCIMLSHIDVPDLGTLFLGYVPSHTLVESQGLYQACGILGATVMPHGLYLGSGIVQPRLREWDEKYGYATPYVEPLIDQSVTSPKLRAFRSIVTRRRKPNGDSEKNAFEPDKARSREASSTTATPNGDAIDEMTTTHPPPTNNEDSQPYRPTLAAIKACLPISTLELSISLFTFALFVNSAILIVAGASLYDPTSTSPASDATLFTIHTLLSHTLAPITGTLFALALLLSGTSAGIVCTIAGQQISTAQLRLRLKPWVMRLLTRSISIVPSIIVAGAVGEKGVSRALMGSQVALSVILPICAAPVVWFTFDPRRRYMTVSPDRVEPVESVGGGGGSKKGGEQEVTSTEAEEGHATTTAPTKEVNLRNHWVVSLFAVVIWLLVVVMNGALIVLAAMGKS